MCTLSMGRGWQRGISSDVFLMMCMGTGFDSSQSEKWWQGNQFAIWEKVCYEGPGSVACERYHDQKAIKTEK